jgi:ribosomal protein L6P/L9E
LQQLGFCSFLLNKVSNRLAQTYTYQKPSAYTGKGLLYLGIEPSRKEGKGKFQR